MKLPTLRPEIFLTLFVFAGIYKAFPLLALPLGLDWTAVMGIVTLLAFLLLFLLEGSVVRTGWSTPDVWLLLLTLVVCIGVLHSSDPTYGLEIASEYLLLGVLASYLLPRFFATGASMRRVIRNAQHAVIALAMITVTLVLAGFSESGRALAGSYLSWGYFVGAASVVVLVRVQSSSGWTKLLNLSMLMAFVYTLLLSQARGPLISFALIVLVMLVTKGTLSRRAKGLLASITIASAVVAPVILPTGTFYRLALLVQQDMGASVSARIDAWAAGVQAFLAHPLLGIGTGSFLAFHASLAPSLPMKYPHNILIGLAAEVGIIGAVLLVGFVLSVFLGWRRCLHLELDERDRSLLTSCVLVFGFLMIGHLFSGHLPSRQALFFAGLAVPFMRSACKRRSAGSSSGCGMTDTCAASLDPRSTNAPLRLKGSHDQ
jgi:O-antigen ligase